MGPGQRTDAQFYHDTSSSSHEEKPALPPAAAGRVSSSIPTRRGSDANDAPTHVEIDIHHTAPLLSPSGVGPTTAAIPGDEKQPGMEATLMHEAITGTSGGGKKKKDYTRCEGQWNNYLSFGLDAQITYSYHHHRETHR